MPAGIAWTAPKRIVADRPSRRRRSAAWGPPKSGRTISEAARAYDWVLRMRRCAMPAGTAWTAPKRIVADRPRRRRRSAAWGPPKSGRTISEAAPPPPRGA